MAIKTRAVNDTAFTSEDAAVSIAVLTNDQPTAGALKSLYSLAQSGTAVVTTATTKLGATISIKPNGTVQYDPTLSAAIQALAQGETATDTFIYTMKATSGNSSTLSTATVTVTLTGVNDPPVITGASANQPTTDITSISPFSHVTITDVDHNAQDSLARHCQVNWHTDECRRPGGADEASRRLADTGLLSPDLKRLGTSAPIADCRHEVASQSEMTVDYRVRR